MPTQKLIDLDLLPKDSFEASNLGKFLRWSLATGRVIVVLTEFVIILAFGSRFWFDRQLNDLVEEIDAKAVVVESFSAIEAQMGDISSRETVVSNYLQNSLKLEGLFVDLIRATPVDVSYETLVVNKEQIRLEGLSRSELGFAGLLANLSRIKAVGDIRLGKTVFDEKAGGLKFELSAKIIGEK